MKKFLLFISTVFLSLLFINNNVNAQEFPVAVVKATNIGHMIVQINENTNEYSVGYTISGQILPITENDYFLVNFINVVFHKGLDRRTNSYEFQSMTYNPDTDITTITIRFTVLKTFLENNYPDGDYGRLFRDDTALYIGKLEPDINDAYNIGFNDGYSVGYNDGRVYGENEGYGRGYAEGYDNGYNDGVMEAEPEAYQRGYNDGAKSSFIGNLHVWIVPAIIIVVIAGIFVGYRRERYGGD